MLREAYKKGALTALTEVGLVKEAGKTTKVLKGIWESAKSQLNKNTGGVRKAVEKLEKLKQLERTPVGPKFLQGHPAAEKALPGLNLSSKAVDAAEKEILRRMAPYAIGAGALGAGYGGYKLLQKIFPDANRARFYSPFGSLGGSD